MNNNVASETNENAASEVNNNVALQQSEGWEITARKHHGRKPKPMMNHNVRMNSTVASLLIEPAIL
jgi:hypothetical protein